MRKARRSLGEVHGEAQAAPPARAASASRARPPFCPTPTAATRRARTPHYSCRSLARSATPLAATYDPIFWPLHGTAERFIGLMRVSKARGIATEPAIYPRSADEYQRQRAAGIQLFGRFRASEYDLLRDGAEREISIYR